MNLRRFISHRYTHLSLLIAALFLSKTWISTPNTVLRDNWTTLALVAPITWLIYKLYFPKILDLSLANPCPPSRALEDQGKRTRLRRSFGNIMEGIRGGFRLGSKRDPRLLKYYEKAAELGGNVGGLVNDGNTCFMNSVLQSMASSNELMDFLSFAEGHPECQFTNSLKQLLDKLNDKHGNKTATFNTKVLLKSLSNGPQRHLFLGYNQEDAQEFYQTLMKELEKDFAKLYPAEKAKEKFVTKTEDMMYGSEKLGELGTVYVPSTQVDPNFQDLSKVYPLKLVTPVDGLQCERIGCLTCGEMGGLRYSVISGLGVNLPASSKASYTIHELLDMWAEPEIIDGVECNRCGLTQVLTVLQSQLDSVTNEKLQLLTQQRIDEIKHELAKPIINDDVYARLHTKNMVQKSRKIKQILFSRAPPLLSIHINRSVFDQRTFMVRKNGAQVQFPLKLDLSEYIAEPDNINTDARLSFKSAPSESCFYSLKAVISHFGTHNYGHYISYRKYRGIWWRISDETVGVCSERDVLNCQGTFMLFYELSERNDPRDSFGDDIEEDDEEQYEEVEEDDDDDDEEESSEDDGYFAKGELSSESSVEDADAKGEDTHTETIIANL